MQAEAGPESGATACGRQQRRRLSIGSNAQAAAIAVGRSSKHWLREHATAPVGEQQLHGAMNQGHSHEPQP